MIKINKRGNITDKWFVRIGRFRMAFLRNYKTFPVIGPTNHKVNHTWGYENFRDSNTIVLSLGRLELSLDY